MSIATPTLQRIVPPFTPTATLTCQVWCPVRGSWGNQADQRQISLIYASTCAPSQELPGAALLNQAKPDLFRVVPDAVTLVWRAPPGSAGQQSARPGVSGCSAVRPVCGGGHPEFLLFRPRPSPGLDGRNPGVRACPDQRGAGA